MMKMATNVVNEKQLREAQLRELELFANSVYYAYNSVVGITFPMHKNLLMTTVFDKGAIPKC